MTIDTLHHKYSSHKKSGHYYHGEGIFEIFIMLYKILLVFAYIPPYSIQNTSQRFALIFVCLLPPFCNNMLCREMFSCNPLGNICYCKRRNLGTLFLLPSSACLLTLVHILALHPRVNILFLYTLLIIINGYRFIIWWFGKQVEIKSKKLED